MGAQSRSAPLYPDGAAGVGEVVLGEGEGGGEGGGGGGAVGEGVEVVSGGLYCLRTGARAHLSSCLSWFLSL